MFEDLLKSRGVKTIYGADYLFVERHSNFWERMGFTRTDETRTYFDDEAEDEEDAEIEVPEIVKQIKGEERMEQQFCQLRRYMLCWRVADLDKNGTPGLEAGWSINGEGLEHASILGYQIVIDGKELLASQSNFRVNL